MPDLFTILCTGIWGFVCVRALLNTETPRRLFAIIGSGCLAVAFYLFYVSAKTVEAAPVSETAQGADLLSLVGGGLFLVGFTFYGYHFALILKRLSEEQS